MRRAPLHLYDVQSVEKDDAGLPAISFYVLAGTEHEACEVAFRHSAFAADAPKNALTGKAIFTKPIDFTVYQPLLPLAVLNALARSDRPRILGNDKMTITLQPPEPPPDPPPRASPRWPPIKGSVI